MNNSIPKKEKLNISCLAGGEVFVIRKMPDSRVFISTSDSLIIGRDTFVILLNYLVKHDLLPTKVLQGILEEYHTN